MIPGFTASASLALGPSYTVALTHLARRGREHPPNRPDRAAARPSQLKACNSMAYHACWNDAYGKAVECIDSCSRNDVYCRSRCVREFESYVVTVCDPLGCPRGTVCKASEDSPAEYCCPVGEVPCGDQCVSYACPAPYVFNRTACGCTCPRVTCSSPRVQDPVTCTCECPPCSGGKVSDPLCVCSCPSGEQDCNGICCDFSTDRRCCGGCSQQCASGYDCCRGVCMNLQTDMQNCGQCGSSCAAGQGCCEGFCANLSTVAHCGDCNTQCKSGEDCCPGQGCVPLGTKANCSACGDTCPNGWDCCGGQCSPLNTIADCGACGNSCTGGMICGQGGCACPSNQKLCDGVCTNVTNDPNNCGDCNVQCVDVQTCQGGKCTCPPNLPTLCNNVCVDTNTDSNNLGICGNKCLPGQIYTRDAQGNVISVINYNTVCQAGKCVCPSGTFSCGPNWCAPNGNTCCYPTIGIVGACLMGKTCMLDSSAPGGFRCQ